jgi:uncharacterized protein
MELLIRRGHECWANAYVVEEARRNLLVKMPSSVPVLDELLSRVRVASAHPHAPASRALMALPEKDRPVLEAAIRLKCHVLLTGDRTHFGQFYGKKVEGVLVHSPRSLADELLS